MTKPDRWIPVAAADAVGPGEIVEIDVSDEDDWVLWRTESGEPCVNAARCPHLWSHFAAEGVIDGEQLICQSHGWRFSSTGSGTIQRRTMVEETTPIAVRPCREVDGQIEVWIGEGEPESAPADTATPDRD